MRAYKVKAKTTNALNDTVEVYESEQSLVYYECENGILYVITDDPRKIYDKFSKDTIIKIEDIGVGYII